VSISSRLVLVFLGPELRANEVWSFLRGHGVEAVLLEQQGGYGFEPVEVQVPASQYEAARELLLEFGLSMPGTPT